MTLIQSKDEWGKMRGKLSETLKVWQAVFALIIQTAVTVGGGVAWIDAKVARIEQISTSQQGVVNDQQKYEKRLSNNEREVKRLDLEGTSVWKTTHTFESANMTKLEGKIDKLDDKLDARFDALNSTLNQVLQKKNP